MMIDRRRSAFANVLGAPGRRHSPRHLDLPRRFNTDFSAIELTADDEDSIEVVTEMLAMLG